MSYCDMRAGKNYLMPYANIKDEDQPAHPRSLIDAFFFFVRCLGSITPILSTFKFQDSSQSL